MDRARCAGGSARVRTSSSAARRNALPRDVVRAVELRSTRRPTRPSPAGRSRSSAHDLRRHNAAASTTAAHKLMPGFTWTGNQTLVGRRPPSCSASTCSPTSRPEPRVRRAPSSAARRTHRGCSAALALPSDSGGIGIARGAYLDDTSPHGTRCSTARSCTAGRDAPATPTRTSRTTCRSAGPARRGDNSGGTASSASSSPVRRSGGELRRADRVDARLRRERPSTCGTPTLAEERLLLDRRRRRARPPGGERDDRVAPPGASKGSTLVPVADVTKASPSASRSRSASRRTQRHDDDRDDRQRLASRCARARTGHAVGDPISSTASSTGSSTATWSCRRTLCDAGARSVASAMSSEASADVGGQTPSRPASRRPATSTPRRRRRRSTGAARRVAAAARRRPSTRSSGARRRIRSSGGRPAGRQAMTRPPPPCCPVGPGRGTTACAASTTTC